MNCRRRICHLPRWIGGTYPGPRGVETAPLPSRFRSSSAGASLMVLIVAFGAEVGWLCRC
jgi:hypothetical protein